MMPTTANSSAYAGVPNNKIMASSKKKPPSVNGGGVKAKPPLPPKPEHLIMTQGNRPKSATLRHSNSDYGTFMRQRIKLFDNLSQSTANNGTKAPAEVRYFKKNPHWSASCFKIENLPKNREESTFFIKPFPNLCRKNCNYFIGQSRILC
jgi:hypothetical protein